MEIDSETKFLREEIDEITALIEQWEPVSTQDPDTAWGIYLLKRCLERRKNRLASLMPER